MAHTQRNAGFSVVICTHNRERLLENAVRSVFAQEYPRDRFEVLVVDTARSDRLGELASSLAREAPVDFRFIVDPRPGGSAASGRNLGVEHARHEYIAFLDDDARATSGWLSAFERAVREHGALVVGGRVEPDVGDDVLPLWLDCPYVQGFYRIAYPAEAGAIPKLRHPQYIGVGNSVYAAELFERFGGFPLELGPRKGLFLVAEEIFLNLLLERNGIDIFYSHDACVHHRVDASRLTRTGAVRRARADGVSTARMHVMLDGLRGASSEFRDAAHQVRRLGTSLASSPRDPAAFCQFCRLVRNLAFLREGARATARRAIGRSVVL